MSVATWSFLERPVCSFLPGSPQISVNLDSIFMWTSSRSIDQLNLPEVISLLILSRPFKISFNSDSVKTSTSLSIVACAIDPSIS